MRGGALPDPTPITMEKRYYFSSHGETTLLTPLVTQGLQIDPIQLTTARISNGVTLSIHYKIRAVQAQSIMARQTSYSRRLAPFGDLDETEYNTYLSFVVQVEDGQGIIHRILLSYPDGGIFEVYNRESGGVFAVPGLKFSTEFDTFKTGIIDLPQKEGTRFPVSAIQGQQVSVKPTARYTDNKTHKDFTTEEQSQPFQILSVQDHIGKPMDEEGTPSHLKLRQTTGPTSDTDYMVNIDDINPLLSPGPGSTPSENTTFIDLLSYIINGSTPSQMGSWEKYGCTVPLTPVIADHTTTRVDIIIYASHCLDLMWKISQDEPFHPFKPVGQFLENYPIWSSIYKIDILQGAHNVLTELNTKLASIQADLNTLTEAQQYSVMKQLFEVEPGAETIDEYQTTITHIQTQIRSAETQIASVNAHDVPVPRERILNDETFRQRLNEDVQAHLQKIREREAREARREQIRRIAEREKASGITHFNAMTQKQLKASQDRTREYEHRTIEYKKERDELKRKIKANLDTKLRNTKLRT